MRDVRIEELEARLRRIEARRGWQIIRLIDTTPRTLRGLFSFPVHLVRLLLRRTPQVPAVAGRALSGSSASREDKGRDQAPPRRTIPPRSPVFPEVVVLAIAEPTTTRGLADLCRVLTPDVMQWPDALAGELPDLILLQVGQSDDGMPFGSPELSREAATKRLADLVASARAQGVPSVLWYVGGPDSLHDWLPLARRVDRVVAATEATVRGFSQELEREVGLLPPAVQPRLFNPVAPGDADREGVLAVIAGVGPDGSKPELLEAALFSRHVEVLTDPVGQPRPGSTASSVTGVDELRSSYQRTRVVLEVGEDEEQLASGLRHVFEALACNASVVVSESISAALGPAAEQVVVAVGGDDLALVDILLRQEELRSRLAVRGLRYVMSSQTYRHRLAELLDSRISVDLPLVSAVVCTMRPDQLPTIVANLRRQSGVRLELVLVAHGFDVGERSLIEALPEAQHVVVLQRDRSRSLGSITDDGFLAASGEYVTKMDDDDHYAPNYLRDQVAAFDYSDADIVGKHSFHAYLEAQDLTVLRFPGQEHRFVRLVAGPTIMIRREAYEACRFLDLPRGIDTRFLSDALEQGLRIYSTDRYNFLYHRSADPSGHTWKAGDLRFLQNGRVVFAGRNVRHIEV